MAGRGQRKKVVEEDKGNLLKETGPHKHMNMKMLGSLGPPLETSGTERRRRRCRYCWEGQWEGGMVQKEY